MIPLRPFNGDLLGASGMQWSTGMGRFDSKASIVFVDKKAVIHFTYLMV